MSLNIQSTEGGGQRTAVSVADQIEKAYAGIKVNKAHYYILAMLLLGVFFDSLEQNAVGVTGPLLRKAWNLTTGDIGFLNTVTFTMVALGRLMTGAIADQYGRRTLLIVNLVIFAFGSLLCALAPSYGFLAMARGVVGFGLGGEIAVAVVMVSEYFGAKQRGTAVAFINVTAAGFGNMLAPAFGILVFTLFPGKTAGVGFSGCSSSRRCWLFSSGAGFPRRLVFWPSRGKSMRRTKSSLGWRKAT